MNNIAPSVLCILVVFAFPFLLWAGDKENTAETARPFPQDKETDIWVIAGQSNAGGYGLLKAPIEPDPRILLFNRDNEWEMAREPLYKGFTRREAQIARAVRENILLQRNDSIVMPQGMTLENFLRQAEETDKKLVGVGPGLFFAKHLIKEIDRPIGLISFGCSSIKQWDPNSTPDLYSILAAKVKRAGGRIRGLVYYQGETDAGTPANAPDFEKDLLRMIDNLRRALNDPDLPILLVQLGRCARRGDAQLINAWETVREAQRQAGKKRHNVYVVSAIDLPTDDAVHISFEGQQRLGRRLAEIALSEVYHRPGHAHSIDVASMELINPKGERPLIRVRFSGVTGRLRAAGRPHGFELRPTGPDADTYHMVYRIDLDPSDPQAVIVGIFHPFQGDTHMLIYGGGMDPYVNIVDEKDIPIPAFGPLVVNMPKPHEKIEEMKK